MLAALAIPPRAQTPDLIPPNPRYFATAPLGQLTFFTADTAAEGAELFAMFDNPYALLVADIAPGPTSSNPRELTMLRDGVVVFSAEATPGDVEPWVYDEGQRQATQLRDIRGGNGSYPRGFTRVGAGIYFSASDGSSRRLWRTDGTVAGTARVTATAIDPVEPEDLVEFNGLLFFTAHDSSAGRELWRTDGTGNGTVRVRDISVGTSSSAPSGLVAYAGRLFFAADDGAHGRELWASDGTSQGTAMVKDVVTGAVGSTPTNLTPGLMVFFVADDGVAGRELWKTDGTATGTVLVKDIEAGPGSSHIEHLTWCLVRHFFVAQTTAHGAELWVTNGTSAGTVQVADIFPGPLGSSPTSLLADGLSVYFAADDGTHGREFWRSGGTAATTFLFDLRVGGASSDPTWLHRRTQLGASLPVVFGAENGTSGREIWGTYSGLPILLTDINQGGSNRPSLPSVEFSSSPTGGGSVTTTIRFFTDTRELRVGAVAISLAATAPQQLPFLRGNLRVSLANGEHVLVPLGQLGEALQITLTLPGVYGDRSSFAIQGFEATTSTPLTASANGVLAGGQGGDGTRTVVVRDGHYSDRTMRYRLPLVMSGPSGSATLGLVYRRFISNDTPIDTFEDSILRVLPFAPAPESRPLIIEGLIDLVPINTSGRKSDKIELRLYPGWPTSASAGQLIWESNC